MGGAIIDWRLVSRWFKFAIWIAAVVFVLDLCLVSWIVVTVSTSEYKEPEEIGLEREVVYDRTAPVSIVPLYMQTDERWGSLQYAGDSDIATSGCGLVCAAMAWSYLSGTACTPAELRDFVGDSYVQDGQNYMPGFCDWMCEQDSTLSASVLYEDRSRALEESEFGLMVFGSLSGQLHPEGRDYKGHVVLLVEVSEGCVAIHDPCELYPVRISLEEFEQVNWSYFISVGRS